MQKFKNWLISVLLKKDKLVAVPTSWQTEYVKLAGDAVRNKQDYFDRCSIKELQDTLADGNVTFKSTMNKQELSDLAYQEFRMTIERN